jgi:vacuolar-type H+-ATPase subunit F/Vma7
MSKMALLADRDTATYFKIGGLRDVFAVDDAEEARKCLLELLDNEEYAVVAITQKIIEELKSTILEVMDRRYPMIVSIPDRGGPIATKTELIGDLIQSKTGIELKLR